MNLKTFEECLDKVIDLVAEQSATIISERPRYIHAVMVIAEDEESGETMQASRVKMLDPMLATVESFDDEQAETLFESSNYSHPANNLRTTQEQIDEEIELAIRKLVKSRDLLNEN